MRSVLTAFVVLLFFCMVFSGCQQKITPQELKKYPIDSMEGILTQDNVVFDPAVSSDGRGSVRIDAFSPTTVRLYEMKTSDIEDARVTYRAKLKTKNVEGKAYLEMWCVFPGGGEYFSRALESPLTGTTDWVTQETPFFVKKGKKPEMLKLNVVIDGKGTVWVDDITIIKGPLK